MCMCSRAGVSVCCAAHATGVCVCVCVLPVGAEVLAVAATGVEVGRIGQEGLVGAEVLVVGATGRWFKRRCRMVRSSGPKSAQV